MALMVTCHWVRVVSDWGQPIWWTCFYSWVMNSSYKTYARVGFFASLMGTWGNKRVKESCRKWKLFWLALWCSMSVWSRPETARSANGTWNKDLQARMLRWLLTAFLRRKIGTKSHTEQRDITRNIIHEFQRLARNYVESTEQEEFSN